MFTKLAIISAALFSVVKAEEDEYEPFFLRMLASNETASNATTPAKPPAPVVPTETTAPATTAAPVTSAPVQPVAPTPVELPASMAADAEIVASIMFPLPDGMTAAELATKLMTDPALAAVKLTMEATLKASFCSDPSSGAPIVGCDATITGIEAVVARILEEAKRQLAVSGAAELKFTIEVTGAPKSVVSSLTAGGPAADGMFAMVVTGIKTSIASGAAAAALESELGITAADLNTHMVAKPGSLVTTDTTATTTTSTTTVSTDATTVAADTTTAGAFGQNAVFAIAMVCFSKLLF